MIFTYKLYDVTFRVITFIIVMNHLYFRKLGYVLNAAELVLALPEGLSSLELISVKDICYEMNF